MNNGKNIEKTAWYLTWLNPIIALTKRYSIFGFGGIPIYYVLKFIYEEFRKDDITTRANSVAFNFFLSLFPAIIFVFTLIPIFFESTDLLQLFSSSTKEILPEAAHDYLFDMIEGVVSTRRGGLQSIGFFFALIFASSGVSTLMYGFDKSYDHTFKKRSFIRHRLVAIFITVLLTILLTASFVLIIFSKQILNSLQIELGASGLYAFWIFKWIAVLIIFYLAITFIYRYGPSMYKRIPFFNPGASLATVFSILASLGFSFFVNNFGRYNEIYGSIGALIVILVWFQFNSFIILTGFELNASIAVNRFLLKQNKLGISPSESAVDDSKMI